jgi:hypothetical protein
MTVLDAAQRPVIAAVYNGSGLTQTVKRLYNDVDPTTLVAP